MPAAPDYRKILTDLYKRYNPEKVGDVDFLLKKFEGREAEMVEKVRLKYGVTEEDSLEPAPPPTPEELARRQKKRKRIALWTMILLLVGGVGAGSWAMYSNGFLDGLFESAPAEQLYVIADTVHTHTHCDMGKDSRVLALPFGQAVTVNDREMTCVVTEIEGKEHFIPQKYLGTDLEFSEIDGIYGNDAARALYDNSYEKRALRNYFSRMGYKGEIPEEKQLQLYGRPLEAEIWQVYGLEGEGPHPVNVVAKGKFAGEKWENEPDPKVPLDFAAIISKRDEPEVRKLVVFEFNKDKVDEFVADFDLTDYPGYYIRPVRYGVNEYFWDKFVVLDPTGEEGQAEEIKKGILLEKENQLGVKYLVEVGNNSMEVRKLRKTIFGYKMEALVE